MARETSFPLIQLSPRGQLTLPAEVRKALGLRAGDAFKVRVEEGEIVLEPVEITPIELYTDARVEEFQKNAELTDEELTRARQAWGL
jgi:AbrB family looped-hinge helix DNA binding protein